MDDRGWSVGHAHHGYAPLACMTAHHCNLVFAPHHLDAITPSSNEAACAFLRWTAQVCVGLLTERGERERDTEKREKEREREIYIYICMHTYMYICVYMHISIHKTVHTYVYPYIMYVCMYHGGRACQNANLGMVAACRSLRPEPGRRRQSARHLPPKQDGF